MGELEATSGAEFDRLFLELMIQHHEGAVLMVKELFDSPGHPYSKGLLASIPRLDDETHGELYAIPGMVPDIHDLPSGCRFADRCFQADDRCKTESPPLTDIGGDRRVACFFPLTGEA